MPDLLADPARAWLRFLLVLIVLGVGFGGSFATIHWWNSLPFVPDEPVEGPYSRPKPNPGGGGPPMGGGGGRGGMAPAPRANPLSSYCGRRGPRT